MFNLLRIVVVMMLVFCSAGAAEAQGNVVTLRHGMTVWEILVKYQGCSASQSVALWSLVMADSVEGTRGAKDPKELKPGHRITIKRDCDGKLFPTLAAPAVNTEQFAKREAELKARISDLEKEKSDLEGRLKKAEDAIATPTKEASELPANTAASSPFWWQIVSGVLSLLLLLCLFAVVQMIRNGDRALANATAMTRTEAEKWQATAKDALKAAELSKAKADTLQTEFNSLSLNAADDSEKIKVLEAKLAETSENLQYPPRLVSKGEDRDRIWIRVVRPGNLQIYYESVDCGAKVATPDNCFTHDREKHSRSSRSGLVGVTAQTKCA